MDLWGKLFEKGRGIYGGNFLKKVFPHTPFKNFYGLGYRYPHQEERTRFFLFLCGACKSFFAAACAVLPLFELPLASGLLTKPRTHHVPRSPAWLVAVGRLLEL